MLKSINQSSLANATNILLRHVGQHGRPLNSAMLPVGTLSPLHMKQVFSDIAADKMCISQLHTHLITIM